MTSVDSNFNFLCGRPHGAGPPAHMRPPEPDPSPRHKWMAPNGMMIPVHFEPYVHNHGVLCMYVSLYV